MNEPILQFGTSRFLLAHVALFVSQALERGRAIGGISVVQTTDNPASRQRIAALNRADSYSVKIRGRHAGSVVDTTIACRGIRAAWIAGEDWTAIRRAMIEAVRVVVSNTGDTGYRLDERDTAAILERDETVPYSFPAKLLALLHARWRERPDAGVTVFPCELVANNGDSLRGIVVDLARQWAVPWPFITYLEANCVWVNSLVDRIVSEPLDPVGAVAEPYALWAIERREGMELPCSHESMVVTGNLRSYEQLKLFFLNLGHSWIAEQWLNGSRSPSATVFHAMNDPRVRDDLEAVWHEEVLPVFHALNLGSRAHDYVATVRERFLNPYLEHRIADIAQNHVEKVNRRIAPLVALADSLSLEAAQPRLRSMLGKYGLAQTIRRDQAS